MTQLRSIREKVECAPFHFWCDYARIDGEVLETAELMWFATGQKLSFFTRVVWTRFSPDTTRDRIDACLAHFTARGYPFRWYVADDSRPSSLSGHLESVGFRKAGATIPMTLDLRKLPQTLAIPDGVDIVRVHNRDQQTKFASLLDDVFMPNEASRPFTTLETALSLRLYDEKPRFLAMIDGEPAATSALVEADGVAGIYAVATAPRFRNRGLGALMTLLPLIEARERGQQIGILHASPMGEPVYRRIGFDPIGTHVTFQSPAPEIT